MLFFSSSLFTFCAVTARRKWTKLLNQMKVDFDFRRFSSSSIFFHFGFFIFWPFATAFIHSIVIVSSTVLFLPLEWWFTWYFQIGGKVSFFHSFSASFDITLCFFRFFFFLFYSAFSCIHFSMLYRFLRCFSDVAYHTNSRWWKCA